MNIRVNGTTSKLAGLFGWSKKGASIHDMDVDRLASDAAREDAAKHAKIPTDRRAWVDHVIARGKQDIELENRPRLRRLRRSLKSLTDKHDRLLDAIASGLSAVAPSKTAIGFWIVLAFVLALYGVANAYVPLHHYLGQPAIFMALAIGVVVLVAMHWSLRGSDDKTLRWLAVFALLASLIGHGALALFRADMFAVMVQQWQTVDPVARQEQALKVYANPDIALEFTLIMLLFTLATELTAGLCFLQAHRLLSASPSAARRAEKKLPDVEAKLADVEEQIERLQNEPELWEVEARLVFLCHFGPGAVPEAGDRSTIIETVWVKPNGGLPNDQR